MEYHIDEFLLQRISFKDENAFALLYDRYGRAAYSLAYRMVGDVQSAEDVVQDVFLNVWRSANSFDSRRGNARSWLLSMVHHRSVDVIRQRRGKRTVNLPEETRQPETDIGGVWQEVIDQIDQQAMKKALNKIPKEQRETIELAFLGGYSHREIAEQTNLPIGTVKSRIRMGMQKLKNLLQDREAIV